MLLITGFFGLNPFSTTCTLAMQYIHNGVDLLQDYESTMGLVQRSFEHRSILYYPFGPLKIILLSDRAFALWSSTIRPPFNACFFLISKKLHHNLPNYVQLYEENMAAHAENGYTSLLIPYYWLLPTEPTRYQFVSLNHLAHSYLSTTDSRW